jgi:hypothetical protein
LISKISLLIAFSCLNTIDGSLLELTLIASISNLSSCFCLEVACFALEAFAENLLTKSSRSAFSLSFLLLSTSACFAITVDAIYQSS